MTDSPNASATAPTSAFSSSGVLPSTSDSTVASSSFIDSDSNTSGQLIESNRNEANMPEPSLSNESKALPANPISPPASSPSITNSIPSTTTTPPPSSASLSKPASTVTHIEQSDVLGNAKPDFSRSEPSNKTNDTQQSSPSYLVKNETKDWNESAISINNETNGSTTGVKTIKHDASSSGFYDRSASTAVKKQKTHEAPSSLVATTISHKPLGSNLPAPALKPDSPLLKLGINPPENSQASNLPKHQIKFALATLRAIKRLKDSGPFLHPVDALKLNVPTYYDTVKRPMDISTMEKKLQTGAYTKISDFGLDMELIVYNCCLFNGTDSFISNMARSVKSSFEKHMGNMPLYELPASVFATNSTSSGTSMGLTKKKKVTTNNNNPVSTGMNKKPTSATASRSAMAIPPVSKVNTYPATTVLPASSFTEASPAFALTPSGIPMIRRDSSVDGRPKREIHPPKPKDLPYSDIRPRKKKYAAELKFCGQLLKELMGKKYEAVSFPFLAPVDPVALNCPTYYKIIKHPMDLSTVQEKINSNQYETADEFEADIKLMFKNCYKFNPAGSPVNDMGRELEAVFDKRWLEKPARLPTPPPSHYYSDDESSGFDSDDEDAINAMTNPAISFLEQQLERMKLDLYKMKKDAARELKRTRSLSRKKRKKSISTSNNGDGVKLDGRKKSFGSAGAIRRRSSASEPLTVTYEMKKELSEKIYNLSEKRIAHVITIIHESMPELKGGDDDEIELDMDQLDPKTVLKLYKYVVSDKKNIHSITSANGDLNSGNFSGTSVTRNSGSNRENGSHRVNHGSGSPHRSPKQSSGSKKKSKPLTEAEQARQIEEIQRKIQQFDKVKDNPEDGQLEHRLGDNDDSSNDEDDSGDDSDESSSEEE